MMSRRRWLRWAAPIGVALGAGVLIGKETFVEDVNTKALPPIEPWSSLPTPVSRAAWGAEPIDHAAANESGFTDDPLNEAWYIYPGDLADVYTTVVIHHSSTPLSSNETMRGIQYAHMQANGWADIGYHYGIDKEGVIYDGRDIHVRGASVAGHNTGTIGVVVMGNFEVEAPYSIQLTALQTLVNWLAGAYALTHLAGHGEFNAESVCPGQYLIRYLDVLASGAGLQRGTGGYIPPAA